MGTNLQPKFPGCSYIVGDNEKVVLVEYLKKLEKGTLNVFITKN